MKVIFCGQSPHKLHRVRAHSHDCYEVIVTTSGSGILRANGENVGVTRGTVTVIPPNTEHENISDCGFSDLYIQTDFFGASDGVKVFMDKTGDIEALSYLLYTVWIRRDSNFEAISSSLLSAIYEYSVSFQGDRYRYGFVSRLIASMAKELGNPDYDIGKEAASLGVSHDYMRRCFREETGVTPLEYLTKMRIDHAKTALRQNRGLSIQQIAAECGFSDQYYFSRCFKKREGVSPRVFRNS